MPTRPHVARPDIGHDTPMQTAVAALAVGTV